MWKGALLNLTVYNSVMTGLESMDCLPVTDENKLLKARARLFTIYFYDTDSYAVNLLGKKAGYS